MAGGGGGGGKNDKFIFSDFVKQGSRGNVVEFLYEDITKGEIEKVTGCGCTDFEILDDRVRGKYNDSTSDDEFTGKSGNYAKPIEKSFTIWLKDGEPIEIQNGARKTINPKKKRTTLRFYANVVKK